MELIPLITITEKIDSHHRYRAWSRVLELESFYQYYELFLYFDEGVNYISVYLQRKLICIALNSQEINTEKELFIRIAEGDEPAFRSLMHQYANLVFYYIKQHCKSQELAEEIVQDIFTQVWLARETLPSIKNFKSFLFVLARNYAIDAIRKLMTEKRHLLNYQQQLSDDKPIFEPDEWKLGLIEKAVNTLPSQQQKAWLLSRKQGLRYAEIAEEMLISKETVKSYLKLANKAIIEYIEKRMDVLLVLLILEKLKP